MDVLCIHFLILTFTFVIWITKGVRGESTGTGNIVPLVLPTQLDSDSSEGEDEDEVEENTKKKCEATSSKYIGKEVSDYEGTKIMNRECRNSPKIAGRKGKTVRSKILTSCVRMC
jgi:hypothetical protein